MASAWSSSLLAVTDSNDQPAPRQRHRIKSHCSRDQILAAKRFEETFELRLPSFPTDEISDCAQTLQTLLEAKRRCHEVQSMQWEDFFASKARSQAKQLAKAKQSRIEQQMRALSAIRNDVDKWQMAIELRFVEFLRKDLTKQPRHVLDQFFALLVKGGSTPLHQACKMSDPAIVQLFLEELQAPLAILDQNGKSVLHVAAEYGCSRVIEVILDHLQADQRRLQQPVQQAQVNNPEPKQQQDIVDGSTASGGDPNAASENGPNEATTVAVAVTADSCSPPDSDEIKLLLHFDHKGFSFVHSAARKDRHEVLRVLVDKRPDVFARLVNAPTQTPQQWTPLHVACHFGQAQVAEFLLFHDATDYRALDAQGSTALHLALQSSPFRLAELVSKFVAAFLVGRIAADFLEQQDERFDMNCVQFAIQSNQKDVAQQLIDLRLPHMLNEVSTHNGWSCLHFAVWVESLELVQLLVAHGAHLDAVDLFGQTPLLYACLGGQLEIARFLVGHGANVLHQNQQAHCALHYLAAYCRDREMLQFVIDKGADVNAKTLRLNAPLHFAAMNGNEIAVQVLLANGASSDAINEDKRSVVYLAKKWRKKLVEELVRSPEEDDDTRDESASAAAATSKNKVQKNATRHRLGSKSGTKTSPRPKTKSIPQAATGENHDSDDDDDYVVDDEEILTGTALLPNDKPMVRSMVQLGQKFHGMRREPRLQTSAPATGRPDSSSTISTLATMLTPLADSQQKALKAQQLLRKQQQELDQQDADLRRQQHLQKLIRLRLCNRLITEPVEVPWDMTVPSNTSQDNGSSSTINSNLHHREKDKEPNGLQRKLKTCITTPTGLLRDQLAHASHQVWPQHSTQPVLLQRAPFPQGRPMG